LTILNKIPRWEKIVPVYAVIVMMIYTWSLFQYFWRLQSWLNFSTLGQVSVIYAYTAVVNFIESALIMLMLVVLSVILPSKWFYDQFVVRGSSLVLFGLGALMIFVQNIFEDVNTPSVVLPKLLVAAIIIIALVILVDRISLLKKIMDELANRMTTFLYIWMPITALSLITVLARNMF
jgi:hypothetical protein